MSKKPTVPGPTQPVPDETRVPFYPYLYPYTYPYTRPEIQNENFKFCPPVQSHPDPTGRTHTDRTGPTGWDNLFLFSVILLKFKFLSLQSKIFKYPSLPPFIFTSPSQFSNTQYLYSLNIKFYYSQILNLLFKKIYSCKFNLFYKYANGITKVSKLRSSAPTARFKGYIYFILD